MHRGYIKLWRKMIDSSVKTNPNALCLLIDLLLNANHKQNKFIWNKEEMIVNRGQILTGRKKLSKNTGLTEREVRTALTMLKSTSIIAIKTYSKFSIITINNYDVYQHNDQQNDQQVTSKRPASDQQVTTNNNDNNDNNEKNEREETRTPSLETIVNYGKTIGINDTSCNDFFLYYESNGWLMGEKRIQNWQTALMRWKNNENRFKTKGEKEEESKHLTASERYAIYKEKKEKKHEFR